MVTSRTGRYPRATGRASSKALVPRGESAAQRILEQDDATILDLLDELLNKGVMLSGDVTLGVAGIDLIYLRLSSVLCAVDRIMPAAADQKRARATSPRARRKRQ